MSEYTKIEYDVRDSLHVENLIRDLLKEYGVDASVGLAAMILITVDVCHKIGMDRKEMIGLNEVIMKLYDNYEEEEEDYD